jgi:ATP-binding cassette subfamily F protein uup
LAKAVPTKPAAETRAAPASGATKKKLSYKEQKELDGLPAQIEALEAQIAELHTAMAVPEFYKQSGDQIAAVQAQLKGLEENLTAAFVRWETLESLR